MIDVIIIGLLGLLLKGTTGTATVRRIHGSLHSRNSLHGSWPTTVCHTCPINDTGPPRSKAPRDPDLVLSFPSAGSLDRSVESVTLLILNGTADVSVRGKVVGAASPVTVRPSQSDNMSCSLHRSSATADSETSISFDSGSSSATGNGSHTMEVLDKDVAVVPISPVTSATGVLPGATGAITSSISTDAPGVADTSPPSTSPSRLSSSSTVASGVAASTGTGSTSTSWVTGATPGSTGSGTVKRGLAYNDPSLTQAFAGKGMSWVYNWAASPGGEVVSGAEYVPMLWGPGFEGSWLDVVASAIAGGSRHVLSFNEPDLDTQSDMSPQSAADNHVRSMNPLAGQVSIGSPAITNGAGTSPPMGIDWLNEFFRACAGNCKIDFVAFHWYAGADQLDYFKQHVQDVVGNATQNGVDAVWLTEFGASGSDADVARFITEAVAYLDSTPSVQRYAYFMCSEGILVDGDSISSPIGEAYV